MRAPWLPVLFVLFTAWAVPADVHDFHVSRLTVNYVSSTGELQLTLDTFIDDLEGAVETEAKTAGLDLREREVDLLTSTEAAAADSLLAVYLMRTLALNTTAGERVQLEYLGKEAADDPYAAFAYLRTSSGLGIDEVALRSDFLLDRYEDQQNIVVWQVDGKAIDHDLLTAGRRTCTSD